VQGEKVKTKTWCFKQRSLKPIVFCAISPLSLFWYHITCHFGHTKSQTMTSLCRHLRVSSGRAHLEGLKTAGTIGIKEFRVKRMCFYQALVESQVAGSCVAYVAYNVASHAESAHVVADVQRRRHAAEPNRSTSPSPAVNRRVLVAAATS
jgi:hypothetical protein